jgi:chromosome segregation ATPase
MEKQIDELLIRLTALRPHVANLAPTVARLARARIDLANVQSQLSKHRAAIKDERDTRARERAEDRKTHNDLIYKHQSALADMEEELKAARAELVLVQKNLAEQHGRLDDLARPRTASTYLSRLLEERPVA